MNLLELLHGTFGFSGFRENQEAVCRAVVAGRDALLVMPTGAGKSLCYQLPAIARRGTGLVISPLIALMDDQAAKLGSRGLRVARIHSGLSRVEAREACRAYLEGSLQFLFIAPERLRVPGFPEMLARRKPALIAVDEAHCISGWGHDFRPDYRALGSVLPLLRPAPILALTATATPAVQQDILAQLGLIEPELFVHGFRRENLAVEVLELSKPRRSEFIQQFLREPSRRPAIVYAPSRKAAEELAQQLGAEFSAAAYHAGLEPAVRERVQRAFLDQKLEVVVATIAFGMGVDKPDIRSVIHAAMPGSVEAYYQEIGRAGRDGQPARAVLLHSFADRKIHESFLERDYPPIDELDRVMRLLSNEFQPAESVGERLSMDAESLSRALDKLAAQGAVQLSLDGGVRLLDGSSWRSGYHAQLAQRRAELEKMIAFAETVQCRMAALVRHFGDSAGASRLCGQCDFCAPEKAQAQRFVEPSASEERDLRALLRTLEDGPRSTGRLLADSGIAATRSQFDVLLDGLARAGLVRLSPETFTNSEGREVGWRKAVITPEGRAAAVAEMDGVLLAAGSEAPLLARPKKKSPPLQASDGASPAQTELEGQLRAWRKDEAARAGKPAFFVLSDAVLRTVAALAPRTLPQLLEISGIGPRKAELYGAAICAICRDQQGA